MKSLKLWWKWRKAKRKHYPFRYVGPTVTLRGVLLEYGTPLRQVTGTRQRGSFGGRQYRTPNSPIVRLINRNQVEVR